MAAQGFGKRQISVEFPVKAWAGEVEQLRPGSRARAAAERARRELELGVGAPAWFPCAAVGADGTVLPCCVKAYVPFGREGASAAPFGFVFRLTRVKAGFTCRMVAFGERHPTNIETRSVYERAHRRLHGRYP
jgi:hypothetical protein